MIPALKTFILLLGLFIWYGFIWLLVLAIPKHTPVLPAPLTVSLVKSAIPLPTVIEPEKSALQQETAPILPLSQPTPIKANNIAVEKKQAIQVPVKKNTTKTTKKIAKKPTPVKKERTHKVVKKIIQDDNVTKSTQVKNQENQATSTTPISPIPDVVPVTPAPIAKVVQTPPSFNAAYLRNPKPAYPRLSKRLGEQGKVLLKVKVSQNGIAEQVHIKNSSGFSRLDTVAQNTVQNWRFTPAQRNGQPISDWVIVPIVFNLTD